MALVIGALVVVGWRTSRRRTKQLPRDRAMHLLMQLERSGLVAAKQTERYFTLLSDIVRGFLEKEYQLDATRQSTAEFLEAAKGSPKLSAEQREHLGQFLHQCDRVKFGRAEVATEACQAAAESAWRFVTQETTPPPQS